LRCLRQLHVNRVSYCRQIRNFDNFWATRRTVMRQV
jgi:hypothetical protein